MVGRLIKGVAVVALALCFSGTARAAEATANPEYTNWSKFKAGSWARLSNESEAAGQKSKSTITQKLVECTPDKCVIEMTMSMEVGGQKMDMPAQKREVPAKAPAGVAVPPVDPKADPKAGVKETTEEVKVGDKTLKCKVMDTTVKQGETTSTSKVWTSDEVPGTVVKMLASTEGAMKSTTTSTLEAFEIAK